MPCCTLRQIRHHWQRLIEIVKFGSRVGFNLQSNVATNIHPSSVSDDPIEYDSAATLVDNLDMIEARRCNGRGQRGR